MPDQPTPPRHLGTVRRTWDAGSDHDDGRPRERRERVAGHAVCPQCESLIELTDDTEAWTLDEDARVWRHSEYGPACGVCCDNLIVDSFEGARVYRLPTSGV